MISRLPNAFSIIHHGVTNTFNESRISSVAELSLLYKQYWFDLRILFECKPLPCVVRLIVSGICIRIHKSSVETSMQSDRHSAQSISHLTLKTLPRIRVEYISKGTKLVFWDLSLQTWGPYLKTAEKSNSFSVGGYPMNEKI